MPVMKALLDKCRFIFNLDANMPDLPPTTSGPVFFNDFQMYSTSKKWRNFIEKKVSQSFCYLLYLIPINKRIEIENVHLHYITKVFSEW